MSGPGPRAAIRTVVAALWAVVAFCLAFYTDTPAELIGLLSGLYMGVWGAGEALYDARRTPA